MTQFNADRGEVDFAYRLGKIFYHGSIHTSPGGIASGGDGAGPVPRDFHRARHYFLRIARQVWPSDPANPRHIQHASKEDSPPTAGYASLAAGYLGRMYLRGEGVKQDTILARMWFERGADYSDKESHNGLGIIWRDGLVDGKVDIKKALAHFGAAASQDLAEAHVQLGKYHWCEYLHSGLQFKPPLTASPYPENLYQLSATSKWRRCISNRLFDWVLHSNLITTWRNSSQNKLRIR